MRVVIIQLLVITTCECIPHLHHIKTAVLAKNEVKGVVESIKISNTTTIVKSRNRRPSSIAKINSLMFFFYATLGSVMPFIPVYYKQIGISGIYILFCYFAYLSVSIARFCHRTIRSGASISSKLLNVLLY